MGINADTMKEKATNNQRKTIFKPGSLAEPKALEILLRRRNKLLLGLENESGLKAEAEEKDGVAEIKAVIEAKTPESAVTKEEVYAATLLKNIESLGYTFSEEAIEILKKKNVDELKKMYLEVVSVLKKLVGANVVYKPLYPNFPEEVMEAEEVELYLNAILHYLSLGTYYPESEKKERLPLEEVTNKLKVIEAGNYFDLVEIGLNLCNSKTSLSSTDKEDLDWLLTNADVFCMLPKEILLKENVALISKILITESNYLSEQELNFLLKRYIKTATDVLRLITEMSGGDVSLAGTTKYRNFNRMERRLIMELLESCGKGIEEDMLRHKGKWIRVGEKLHPAEYKNSYPTVNEAYRKLRNCPKEIKTYASKVEQLLATKELAAINLLKKRPGELARKLDYLLRLYKENEFEIVNAFREVAVEVATPVLLQVREHFKHRNQSAEVEVEVEVETSDSNTGNNNEKEDKASNEVKDTKYRVFFPKGRLANSYNVENKLEAISEKACKSIVRICENALVTNYSKRDWLGNVYVSKEFKNYIVPFSQRSANKTLKTMVRGSRVPIPASTKVLRGFIWWTNDKKSRVDLDLSGAIFDENWNYMEHISYTNLRSKKYRACHSGDITNGGNVNGKGVSEFIDIDIDSVVKYGGRYVVYQVYSYTQQILSELPHASFGWMNREDVKSGEIYEPKTVEQKMDLTTNGCISIPVIFDCVNREIIWGDMGVSLGSCYTRFGGNNVESNLDTVAAVCYSVVNMQKPTLYDLIALNTRARGLMVDDKEEADIIFDVDGDITPYDLDVYMAEYL